MRNTMRAMLTGAALAVLAGPAGAMEGVVTTIKPIHSLAAAVMQGAGEPQLLIKGAGSPHDYTMRPSDAAALENARLVFQIGPDLERFLERPLASLAASATVVSLAQAKGVSLLDFREGGPFEAHSHEGEDHAHHHDDDDHDHGNHHDHSHDHDHDHDHGAHDMHIWLDPENARAMAGAIAAALTQADPTNEETYRANAERLDARLEALSRDIAAKLEPVKGQGFIVFHDAYQYFERHFDIPASGSITVSPDVTPGAQRLGEIRQRVRDLGATCVFSEPQFEPRLVSVVTEGTQARSGVLDPLGAEIPEGPEQYPQLLRNLADSLAGCLGMAN